MRSRSSWRYQNLSVLAIFGSNFSLSALTFCVPLDLRVNGDNSSQVITGAFTPVHIASGADPGFGFGGRLSEGAIVYRGAAGADTMGVGDWGYPLPIEEEVWGPEIFF